MAQPADESKALESEIFRSRYRVVRAIGKGSFGVAVLVRSKLDGKRYVAKVIESASMTAKEKRDVNKEIRILAAVKHPNIIRYQEHFEDGSLIFIIMEYASGGDLSTRIKEAKKADPPAYFDPQMAMFIFLQICLALKYLHDNHVLHRDLKSANVFLTSQNIVKLGDFGISTVLQNTMACAKTICGTPYYFSPELCLSKPYNNKSDVWSLGVVFYEILTLQRPFNAKSLKELLKKILAGNYDPLPPSVPKKMVAVCTSLLQVNPVQRPSINRILLSSYVQETLRHFSSHLELQAEESAETGAPGENRRPPQDVAPTKVETPNKVTKPQLSEREQMAMLRGMDRESMKAMLAKQAVEADRLPEPAPTEYVHPDVDDDCDDIAQKRAIAQQSREIVGKTDLGGHPEEFGDGPSDSTPQVETITLHDGRVKLASEVRAVLEREMGEGMLNSAMELFNTGMMDGTSNAEMQAKLIALVGHQNAHHANAITKLALWEGKQKVVSAR